MLVRVMEMLLRFVRLPKTINVGHVVWKPMMVDVRMAVTSCAELVTHSRANVVLLTRIWEIE